MGRSQATAKLPSVTRPAVDVATGEVTDTAVDFRRDALLPAAIARHYSSFEVRSKPYIPAAGDWSSVPFGSGWQPDWAHSLRRTAYGFVYTRPGAGEIDLRMRAEGRICHTGHCVELEYVDSSCARIVDYSRGRAPVVYVFAGANSGLWYLRSIEHRRSHRIDVRYDGDGRVARLEHTRLRCALVLNYRNGRISHIEWLTPEGGRHFVAEYRYTANGLLAEVHDRSGVAASYLYDERDLLTSVRNRAGAAFAVYYDAEGRCVRIGGLDGYHLRTFSYDRADARTVMSNAQGERWTYDFDPAGHVVKTTSPLGRERYFEFDEVGLLERTIDEAKHVVLYEHDDFGRLVARDDLFTSTRWEYDPWHRIIWQGKGTAETSFTYDENHDLVAIDGEHASWELVYNLHGEWTSLTNPLGQTRTRVYDAFGNLVEESDFRGSFSYYEYDAFGRCVKTTDPLGAVDERCIDELDRLLSSTRTGTGTIRFQHDGDRRVTLTLTGAEEMLRNDVYGRIREHVDSAGIVGRLVWGKDPEQILSVANAAGARESYYYDADGRVVEVHMADGRVVRADYGASGVCSIRVLDATSRDLLAHVSVELDPIGRPVRLTAGEQTRRFEYDERGEIAFAETEDVAVFRRYDTSGQCIGEEVEISGGGEPSSIAVDRELDVLGRVVRVHCDLAPDVELDWDENSRVTCARVGPDAVHYARDAMGAEFERSSSHARVLTNRDAAGREIEWVYEPVGRSPVIIRGSYDTRGFLSFMEATMADVQESTLVRHDPRGRLRGLIRLREGSSSRFFAYDGEGHWGFYARTMNGQELLRLVEEAGWDRMPSIVAHHADEIATVAASTDGRLHQVRTGDATVRYTWDRCGRVSEKTIVTGDGETTWRFEFDAWDSLRRAEGPQGAFCYRYDAFGRCVERVSPKGAVTRIIWDGERILHLFVGGTLTETRVHAKDTGELLMRRFHDGSLDIRSDRFCDLESQLGSRALGPFLGSSATPHRAPPRASSFYDVEAGVVIAIRQYRDMATGYDLTWQCGDQPFIPTPICRRDTDDIDAFLERGAAASLEQERPVPSSFMSSSAVAVFLR